MTMNDNDSYRKVILVRKIQGRNSDSKGSLLRVSGVRLARKAGLGLAVISFASSFIEQFPKVCAELEI